MFKWDYNNNFIFFIVDENNDKVLTSDWERFKNVYLSELQIIFELIDNGFAKTNNDSCICDANVILDLSDLDKQILGLPENYPYEIYIQSDGQLNQDSFKFKYAFYDFIPHGNKLKVRRDGPLASFEERDYLLSKNQFLAIEAMNSFNKLEENEKTFSTNLLKFNEIKKIAKNSPTILDEYLTNQEVYCPNKIKIDIAFFEESLNLLPLLDGIEQQEFLKIFDRFPTAKDNYPITQEKNKIRIVFGEKQKAELVKIKDLRKIDDKARITQIIEHPEYFFDEELIDLSVFYSDRVKEIGIYKPKFYPFISPYKSEWIPGIGVDDKIDGQKLIKFENIDELIDFEKVKENSLKKGLPNVNWKGLEIPINDAENFIKIAKKQFEKPSEPVNDNFSNEFPEVLIIKENSEVLEHVEKEIESEFYHNSFKEINNLNSDFELKNHQKIGIAWLQSLYDQKLRGCLLADDMGLGKTIQLLYFIEWHSNLSTSANKPYLVVAPVALLENWEIEYDKFFENKSLSILRLYGSIKLTSEFNSEKNQEEAKKLTKKQIILTNYETLRKYQATLCLVDYSVVVLDEAQRIKTPGTLVTNASKALKADFKITMTGTPVENTLLDLWCIMDFSVPGLLGNAKDFSVEYVNPFKNESKNLTEIGDQLRQKIGYYLLRRLKKDVIKDLPNKLIHTGGRYSKEMPLKQFERYQIEINIARNSNLEGTEKRNQILRSLWAIRDISDHPFLLDRKINEYSAETLISNSSKLQILINILDEVKLKKEKVIIFADRKETQRMLQKVVYDIFNLLPSIINGDTPSISSSKSSNLSRQQTIDKFQSQDGFNVIILSQLAVGVGLNIVKANHVVHFTRHWNPAKEQQATDRVYRIGQEKEVHVYYPKAVFPNSYIDENGKKLKSFDEVLDDLLNLKNELAIKTLFPTEQTEVKPDEIFSRVFASNMITMKEEFDINSIDELNSNLFEALVATLYNKMGYNVFLTPFSNDKGADVVAISDNSNHLIQVKQSKNNVGIEAIQEIFGSRNYYINHFKKSFELSVITNSDFSKAAIDLAKANEVQLINRESLVPMLQKYNIQFSEINLMEQNRLKKI